MTKKPIILKGILSKHDALRAYNLGMDGFGFQTMAAEF